MYFTGVICTQRFKFHGLPPSLFPETNVRESVQSFSGKSPWGLTGTEPLWVLLLWVLLPATKTLWFPMPESYEKERNYLFIS